MGGRLEGIHFSIGPAIQNDELNELFRAAWPGHRSRDFGGPLAQSLGYVCATHEERLIGFVNLAWDGGVHAFLLDPTVHPDYQRRGIGTELVKRAAGIARERQVEWLHVDYYPALTGFYRRCGFATTSAGLMKLASNPVKS